MLVVRGLRKTFAPGRRGAQATVALAGVDLDVAPGEFVSVVGASGSGKTTLLRCVAGFERPDDGRIVVAGRECAGPERWVPAFERGVGIVPQEGALFPHLSVARNVAFGLHTEPRAARRRRVDQMLELVGLEGLGERRPDQLSGGQQQRVALARALAPEPSMILLDEPFSALDARLQVALREEVRDVLRRVGTTVVLVTHDQAEAMSFGDTLVVMRDGRMVETGSPRDLYERPADVDLGAFLGDGVILSGRAAASSRGTVVECALGEVPVLGEVADGSPCRVLVRPEHVSLVDADSAQPFVTGTVVAASYFGHDALVYIEVPGIARPVAVRVPGRSRHSTGERVALSVREPLAVYAEAPAPSAS